MGCEVNLTLLPLPKARASRARPLLKVSPFQPVVRDFAFVVDDQVAAEQLVRAARGADKALIADVGVFDRFTGGSLPPVKGGYSEPRRMSTDTTSPSAPERTASSARLTCGS